MSSSQNYLSKDKSHVEKHVRNMAKGEQRRKLAAERKKYRRNRQPKGPRRKDWIPDAADVSGLEAADLDDWYEEDDEDVNGFERIMPLDERERRRELETAVQARADAAAAAMQRNGNMHPADEPPGTAHAPELVTGLVVEFGSGLCRVDMATVAANGAADEPLLCSLRGSLSEQESGFTNPVAVGDRVLVRLDSMKGGAGGGVVESVLPRRSFLARPDVFLPHLRQILVANVDQLLIVASWRQPALWFELVDRYLIAAARSSLPALLCVNKLDLADSAVQVEEALAPYAALGVPYLLTSAETGLGIDALRGRLAGKSTVLAGLSGVGKSTLLTAIQPSLALRTGEVSDRKQEGRHTTTQATLLRLDASTLVVDTPGIREFGLAGLRKGELAAYFPEIAALSRACRFRDCAHLDEPECAVRAAAERGQISQQRYRSYRQIHAQLS